MTKFEELKAAYDAAHVAWATAYDAAHVAWATADAAKAAAHVAWATADAAYGAYQAELKKTEE